jgi:hypothetical protein
MEKGGGREKSSYGPLPWMVVKMACENNTSSSMAKIWNSSHPLKSKFYFGIFFMGIHPLKLLKS